jgi:hypothetical protein
VWEVVVSTWHDVDCEQLHFSTSSNLHVFQHIRLSDKSFMEKLRRIAQEKEKKCRNQICKWVKEAQ